MIKEILTNHWYLVHVLASLFWCLALIAFANIHKGYFIMELPEKLTSDDNREKGWALILTVLISNLPVIRFFVFIAWAIDAT